MIQKSENLSRKKTEVFHRPNPYDLIEISTLFDDTEIKPPPKTYFPASNPEEQLVNITNELKHAFGNNLLFIGLTGSRAVYPDKAGADLDVIAVVRDNATGDQISFDGDLKIVSYSGIKEFIECGYQLITTQIRKARPIFEREPEILDKFRSLRPVPEKAIPFLIRKSKFNQQTVDIFFLASQKYRAVFFDILGFQSEAFSQLNGENNDLLFQSLQTNCERDDAMIYAKLANYYSYLGLNRMFHSLSEITQALHIQKAHDIADVEELVDWSSGVTPQT